MNKVAKNVAKKLLVILLFTTPLLHAGRGGSSFAGGMAGSMFGSMLGSAMTRPRTRTVVVQDTGNVTRLEAQRLEQLILDLENRVRRDLNTLLDRIRKDENTIRSLQDTISRLEGDLERVKEDITRSVRE